MIWCDMNNPINGLHIFETLCIGFVWFGFFVLMAYQLFLGYLMPKPFT